MSPFAALLFIPLILRTGMRAAGIVSKFCYKCIYPNGSSATKFRFILCSATSIEDSTAREKIEVRWHYKSEATRARLRRIPGTLQY
jgi:hypothetical protein